MERVKTATERYWVFYYLVYIASSVFGVCWYWERLLRYDWVLWLAAIFGASVGFALFVAIILEVSGRMVLLIPNAIRKIKAEGRAEERKRIRTALAELARKQEDGREMLSKAEVLKVLQDDAESRP